jgi:hypothetical protein
MMSAMAWLQQLPVMPGTMKQVLTIIIVLALFVPVVAAVAGSDPYQRLLRLKKHIYNRRSSGGFKINCGTIGPTCGRFRIRLLS